MTDANLLVCHLSFAIDILPLLVSLAQRLGANGALMVTQGGEEAKGELILIAEIVE